MDEVTAGQWTGETPATENVEIIGYLDAICPIPSNEQYIPFLKFDIVDTLSKLVRSDDSVVCGNAREVVRQMKEFEVPSNIVHLKNLKSRLEGILAVPVEQE